MEIEFVILADSVEVTGKKLYMLGGGWNLYRASNYPVQIQFGLAISLWVEPEEVEKERSVEIEIVDEEGKRVAPNLTASVRVGRSLDGEAQRFLLGLNGNLRIPRPSRYWIRAKAGKSKREISFKALLVKQEGPTVH